MSQPANPNSLVELFQCMDRPLDSVNLRRIFLMLMRAHWMDASNHGSLSQYLNCVIYSDDPKDKGTLSVELSHVYDPDKGKQAPAIYVGFDGFNLHTLSVGDSAGRREDNSARREAKKAITTLRVAHTATSADTALYMAESNATLLQGIHRDIMRSMEVLDFKVLGWTDPKQVGKAPDRIFQVDLSCSISFNFMVEIDIESHRIKKFANTYEASTS